VKSRLRYRRYGLVPGALAMTLWAGGQGETYKLGSTPAPQTQKPRPPPQAPEKTLGWGSNIQNVRLARAAEAALENHNYVAAVDFAQRAAQSAPNDAQLWFLLGYAARLDGKPQLALDSYNRGLRLNPASLEGMSGLAQTYSVLGHKDEAQTLLRHVLTTDPKRTGDLLLLGEMLLQTGQDNQALGYLERAERLQPGARAELLLALLFQRTKRFNDAKRYLDIAKKRAPNNPEVLRSLASFYRETGDYTAAISILVGLRNTSPEMKAEVAYTYQLLGKPEEAARLYAEAAYAAEQDLNLQLSAAQSELGVGAIEAAKGFLNRAAGLDADHYRVHAIRGEIDRLEEHHEDAIQQYKLALRNLPEASPEGILYPIQLHMNLMELDQRLGDQTAAQMELHTAKGQNAKNHPSVGI
jgi:tetratricopeptide (TPR) repeat protein